LNENDFKILEKGGYVQRSAPAAKVEENPQLGKEYNAEKRKLEQEKREKGRK